MPEARYKSPEEALKFMRKWLIITCLLTVFLLPLGIFVTLLGVNMRNLIVFILGFIIDMGVPFSLAIIIDYKYDKMLWGEMYNKVLDAVYKKDVWKVVPDFRRRVMIIIMWILLVAAYLLCL